MDEQQWRKDRDDRTLRYAERCLDANRWIIFTADSDYASSYEGQIALLTAANLLGRMSPSIALGFTDVCVHSNLPWSGCSLHSVILAQMRSADPFTRVCSRTSQPGDYRLHFGRGSDSDSDSLVIHGCGWNAYFGTGSSPLTDDQQTNPIGAALAAILAVSQLFVHNLNIPAKRYVLNALTWQSDAITESFPVSNSDLGHICVVGVGSVGTAALYFLALANRSFKSTLIDMDRVKLQNLDRSPIFANDDVGLLKVEATRNFLRSAGFTDVQIDSQPLHKSELWIKRSSGTPDILISAANEMNVRYHIEAQYPPIQLYGTTGRNWQASIIRHIPLVESCSCCLFPDEIPIAAMACASAPLHYDFEGANRVDAALPFLSFAAGLMTAAEVLKLTLPGYPFSANRVYLTTRPSPRLVAASKPNREGCFCNERSQSIYRKMLEGSRYAFLSYS